MPALGLKETSLCYQVTGTAGPPVVLVPLGS